MPQPLDRQTIAIVQATVPALAEHGQAITRAMYKRLFQNPDIAALFNQSHQGQSPQGQPDRNAENTQSKALADAILAYARNIENPGVLAPAVERIAQKHVGLHIRPEHYPHVATALLAAIQDVLGEAATPAVLDAWGEAYWFLADLLIERERVISTALETAAGGWSGWRDFVISGRVRESAVITSFILTPRDGGPVIRHQPGQYLTLDLAIPGHPAPLRRNYSISCAANGRDYRISVKREPHGAVSGWLHDQATVGSVLRVAPPVGDFFLPDQPTRPVVLLSGGVGLTPMVAMLETIAARHPDLPVHYVHGCLNSATHALGRHVRDLATGHPGIAVTDFYSEPLPDDTAGGTHDVTGLISVDWLRDHTPFGEADFYLCGPRPFLHALVSGLVRAGVAAARIHHEFFGPAEELAA